MRGRWGFLLPSKNLTYHNTSYFPVAWFDHPNLIYLVTTIIARAMLQPLSQLTSPSLTLTHHASSLLTWPCLHSTYLNETTYLNDIHSPLPDLTTLWLTFFCIDSPYLTLPCLNPPSHQPYLNLTILPWLNIPWLTLPVWPRLGWEPSWVDFLEGALYKTAVIRIRIKSPYLDSPYLDSPYLDSRYLNSPHLDSLCLVLTNSGASSTCIVWCINASWSK